MQMEMSFTEKLKFYYKNFFAHYLNLSGRASRSEFWLLHLFDFIIAIIGFICLFVPGVIWGLVIIIPKITLSVRRFHDRGLSGWYLLLISLVVFISYVIMLIAMSITKGAESFGASLVEGVFALLYLALSIVVLVICCLPSQKGENKYGFCPIEMENILNQFKAIETICVGVLSMGRDSGNRNLFAFIAELEQSKGLFQQIYTAKERLNRIMLLNGTIERVEHIRHEVTLQSENPKFLLEQLEQLENKLRALPSSLL